MSDRRCPGWCPCDDSAVQADDALLDALRLIDRYGCETFTSGRCSDPNSGRTRGAEYGGHAWCAPCVAADALSPEGDPVGQMLAAWRRAVESEPITRALDTDTALAVVARNRQPEPQQGRLRRLWHRMLWL